MQVDISFVITVFNKEKQLLAAIGSLLEQTKDIACEFIFVDDASTDNSVQVIKEILGKAQNLIIINNEQNVGPAVSLNKGCMAASGKYLFLIDADDILAKNALGVMFNAIQKERADFVFGFHKATELSQLELLNISLPENTSYQVSNNPLDTVLDGKYVRMAYLVTKELYLKSGGADERIFIQDESLPLRLAYSAKKMVSLNHPAVYAAKDEHSLSKNKLQQLHDRFYAYYFALSEFQLATPGQKMRLYQRAVSSIWKAKKASANLTQKIVFFIVYLGVKIFSRQANLKMLKQSKFFIDSLENVRKIH
ncbi:MAG: hypothetical protein Tsb006_2860 [Rickettsiaceae bacterium]